MCEKNAMSTQMLEVSVLEVGTVLGLKGMRGHNGQMTKASNTRIRPAPRYRALGSTAHMVQLFAKIMFA